MTEGFWINSKTNKFVPIDEHAMWITNEKNYKKIGLSKSIFNKIKNLNPQSDRVEILTSAMADGLIRVRGHGTSITFEFSIPVSTALWSIYAFLKKVGVGEFTGLYIANLRTKESISTTYGEFQRTLKNEGEEALLRAANTKMKFNYSVQLIAKKILFNIGVRSMGRYSIPASTLVGEILRTNPDATQTEIARYVYKGQGRKYKTQSPFSGTLLKKMREKITANADKHGGPIAEIQPKTQKINGRNSSYYMRECLLKNPKAGPTEVARYIYNQQGRTPKTSMPFDWRTFKKIRSSVNSRKGDTRKLIRNYLTSHPGAGRTEVARYIYGLRGKKPPLTCIGAVSIPFDNNSWTQAKKEVSTGIIRKNRAGRPKKKPVGRPSEIGGFVKMIQKIKEVKNRLSELETERNKLQSDIKNMKYTLSKDLQKELERL